MRNSHKIAIAGATALTLMAGSAAVASAVTSAVITSTTITSFTFCKDKDGTMHYVAATTACSAVQTRFTLAGLPGPAGPAGPTGAQGSTGLQGPAGPQGPTGPTGAAGLNGSVGPQGPAGNDGAQGPAGPQGLKGDTGLQGPKGDAGPQGPAGPVLNTCDTPPAPNLNFAGCNFYSLTSPKYWAYVDLTGANLTSVNFGGTPLPHAILAHANLTGTP